MSSHRAAHPVAHATHLASRVPAPRHPAAPWSRRLPVGRVCGCAGAGRLRRAAVGAGPGRARCRAHRRPLLVDGRGGRRHLARRRRPRRLRHACPARSAQPRARRLLIIGGGAVLPTVVLAGLLAYGLALLPELLAPAPEGSLQIAVSGEQWWWRVRYLTPGGNGEASSSPTRSACRSASRWSFTWRAPTSSTRSGFRPSAARST